VTGIIVAIKPKASAVTGARPTTLTVQLGEVAINTFDGALYTQINQSGTTSIVCLAGIISFSGDISGSGRPGTAIATTLKATGTAGTYQKVTTDAQGRVTSGAAMSAADVDTALGYTPLNPTQLGAVNGIAQLGSDQKLLPGQIPSSLLGAMIYQGAWNANTNSPPLASGTGTKGWFYKVSVPGTTVIDGNSQWNVGDQLAFDGTVWDKFDGEATEVISVAGKVGAVTLALDDLTDAVIATPTNGQVLQYNGTHWVNQTPTAGGTGTVRSQLPALQRHLC
jgi:hypothetical protein